jgi:electron transfer flavoprotein beta subunit
VRIHRLTTTGYDVLEAPTPAVVMGTQLLGAPRYPSLRGIMQARTKPMDGWTLADLGIDAPSVGADSSTTKTLDADRPPERAGAMFVREAPDMAVAQLVDFLASRRLI